MRKKGTPRGKGGEHVTARELSELCDDIVASIRTSAEGPHYVLGRLLWAVARAADRVDHKDVKLIAAAAAGAIDSSPKIGLPVLASMAAVAKRALERHAHDRQGQLLFTNAFWAGLDVTTNQAFGAEVIDAVEAAIVQYGDGMRNMRVTGLDAEQVLRETIEFLWSWIRAADRYVCLLPTIADEDAIDLIARDLRHDLPDDGDVDRVDLEVVARKALRVVGVDAKKAHNLINTGQTNREREGVKP